jgi:hypothetical protein
MLLAVNIPNRTAGRAGEILQRFQAARVDYSALVSADPFENRDQIDGLPSGVRPAAIEPPDIKIAGYVDAHRSHQSYPDNFVAIRDTHHAIETVRLQHGLH